MCYILSLRGKTHFYQTKKSFQRKKRSYIKIETKPQYKQDILSIIIFTLLFVFKIIGVDLFKDWPYMIGYIVLVVIGIIVANNVLNRKKNHQNHNTKSDKPI